MLDIKLFRENPELIFDSEKKRFRGTETAVKVIEYDTLWREGEKRLNFLRSEKNRLSKSFKKAKQEGNLEEVIAQSKEVANEIKELGPKIEEYKKLRDDYGYKVGNIIDEDVPISDTEDDNKIVKNTGDNGFIPLAFKKTRSERVAKTPLTLSLVTAFSISAI